MTHSLQRHRRAALVVLLSVAALVAALGVAPSAAPAATARRGLAPGDHWLSVTVGGRVRQLVLHVPAGPPLASRPLVLVYHGATDTAAGTARSTDFEKVSDQKGNLVAFLQGYGNSWNDLANPYNPAERAGVNDVAFTSAAITAIEAAVAFSHTHIAAVGFSNGALMVELLGCQLASKLSVVIPVEGELATSQAKACKPSRPISVYEIHGTSDASIPYWGGSFRGAFGGTINVLSAPKSVAKWAQLDGCAANPALSSPSGGILLSTYANCKKATKVILRTIKGGAHEWGSTVAQIVSSALPR